jgi:putative sporulation protein YyaC
MNFRETGDVSMIYNSHYLDKKSIPYFSEALVGHYVRQPGFRKIAVVCLGSHRYFGDSLGPRIGSRLAERLGSERRVSLFGTSEKPVHALNLPKTLSQIAALQDSAYVIAVDACLGRFHKIGTIQLVEEPLKPGAALGKTLPAIGHIHFKGIVNNHAPLKPEILEHPSLRFLDEMALVMSRSLVRTIQQIVPLLLPNDTTAESSSDPLTSGM